VRIRSLALAALILALTQAGPAEAITRIWLTHTENTPESITINWETGEPGPSRVEFGVAQSLGNEAGAPDAVTLHHVTVPFPESGLFHYRVASGDAQSAVHTVKTYSGPALRIAVAADWQDTPPLDALQADDPHLLVSCGDLVHGLMRFDTPGDKNNTEPFSRLVGKYPTLFATTPFLPVLGNHDRQLFPRLLKPTATAIYDVDATAFRAFFPLPDPGWRWHFDVPEFGMRLIALDMNHTADFGTTWQSSHAFDADAEQFTWYRSRMAESTQPFVLTLYNEWHRLVEKHADGGWMPLFQQGSAAISGFGLFAERADFDGLPCFNTALQTGQVFAHGKRTRFHRKVPSYLLVTLPKDGATMRVDIKALDSEVMDSTEWPARKP